MEEMREINHFVNVTCGDCLMTVFPLFFSEPCSCSDHLGCIMDDSPL